MPVSFGDRGIAVAPDQVNGDAEFGQFLRVHVAARAGAQEHHVLEACALAGDVGRQRGVIDDRDLGAVEHFWQLIRLDVRVAVNAHCDVAGFCEPLENHGKGFVGVDKYSAH